MPRIGLSVPHGFHRSGLFRRDVPVSMIPNSDRWLHYIDLNMMVSHIMVQKKQLLEARRVNLRDAGEICNDVMATQFLDSQHLRLGFPCRMTTKLTGEGGELSFEHSVGHGPDA